MLASRNRVSEVTKDYSAYWELQILLTHTFAKHGLKVGPKDRLPIFRLYRAVDTQMTGEKALKFKSLLEKMVSLRRLGLEPPHENGMYL